MLLYSKLGRRLWNFFKDQQRADDYRWALCKLYVAVEGKQTCLVTVIAAPPLQQLWWLENKRIDYQHCSVVYCVPQLYMVITTCKWEVLAGALGNAGFWFSLGVLCVFFWLRPSMFYVVFGVFSLVYFDLSIPLQVIACKNSFLK